MNPSKNLGMDVGTSGGDWLFRQGELVLGPVPATQIVEKLYAGDLDGKTEIARMGTPTFRRLADVEFFKLHLAKAEAKKRVDHLAVSEAAKGRRRRNAKLVVVSILSIAAAGGLAWVGRYFAVHNPFSSTEDPFGDIEMSPPVIALASARGVDSEELVDYPGATVKPKPGDTRTDLGALPKPKAIAKAARPGSKPGVQTDEEGMETAKFDQDAINGVVASNQRSLYPCIRAEAERKPGLSAQIPIEFVIGNDGRVSKVWVDHPSFKEGALPECLLRALQKWPFKAYDGERATVQLKFKVGKG